MKIQTLIALLTLLPCLLHGQTNYPFDLRVKNASTNTVLIQEVGITFPPVSDFTLRVNLPLDFTIESGAYTLEASVSASTGEILVESSENHLTYLEKRSQYKLFYYGFAFALCLGISMWPFRLARGLGKDRPPSLE